MRVSVQEMQALVDLAVRAPKTRAEQLWLSGVVQRLNEREEEQSGPMCSMQSVSGASPAGYPAKSGG